MTTASRRFRHRRWSDNDVYFGPFTFARNHKSYRPIGACLSSGDEDYPGASFRVSAFGCTAIVALPAWVLRPHRERKAAHWDEETIKRLGRDWYESIHQREYGFSLSEGMLSVRFGRQTMDSSTEQSWCYFLPWTQWRHVRHSFYGLDGQHVVTLPEWRTAALGDRWAIEQAITDAVPTMSFQFKDYDGEEIIATTKIEEMEWRFGTGYFKWLSWFRSPRIRRYLDLHFSKEVGPKKGSWKGGTVGHSIEMKPDERHLLAFLRYCAENNLTFIAVT